MDHEAIESIRALEKQIEEGKGDTVKLKRARNSLLNISTRVPPEILGEIFSWTLVRGDPTLYFDGLPKGSYNFLLVCHHWFEVASNTPKLWTFWGNTLEEWKKRHHRHPQVAPLDLVLNTGRVSVTLFASIDDSLADSLRDRATRDTIRQVHLLGDEASPLSKVISLLTPVDKVVQHRSIESIALRRYGVKTTDVSDFFSRVYLPKLRSLLLHGPLRMPSWDLLARQTTLLTTLSINITFGTFPTISQLFSILASNPGLQMLSLSGPAVPGGGGDGPMPQVELRHLKKLHLNGTLRHVLTVLDRLSFPRPLDSISLITSNCTAEDVSQAFVPYLKLYLRPDRGLPYKLTVEASPSYDRASIRIRTEDEADMYTPFSATFTANLGENVPEIILQNLCHDFIASIPQERVWNFNTNLPPNQLEELLVAMPNTETLVLSDVVLSEGFLQPSQDGPYAGKKLVPSLRSLRLKDLTLSDGSWKPLVTYLDHQTSDSKPISLGISGFVVPHMCPEVEREIEDMVEGFRRNAVMTMESECPLGCCEGGTTSGG